MKKHKFEVRVYGISGIVIHSAHYEAQNLLEAARQYYNDTFAQCAPLTSIGSVRFITLHAV